MKKTLSSTTRHYLARVSTFVLAIALIAGMTGCEPKEQNLTISSTAGGTVGAPGTGTFTYQKGTKVDLEAIPYDCYEFVSWTGDVGTIADVDAATTTINMNGDYSITGNFTEAAVTFADPNLEAAVRDAIAIPAGTIYSSDLAGLTYLDASARNITDLSGLECATSLTYLELRSNQINDISPLATLTNLTELYLMYNQISDVSPLANLTSLIELYLDDNQISNISPLANLTSLTVIDLGGNQISDISPLANLTDLTLIDLGVNQISDISPLVQNQGLGPGDEVDLQVNPLSSDSINTYIPQLQGRGVIVTY